MKVAVFGHYDSRGGTTAITLPDNPTAEDVQGAINKYNEMFEWEAMIAMLDVARNHTNIYPEADDASK